MALFVARPGGFCTHGRVFVPMPILEVEGVGILSFPVPDFQVRLLVESAFATIRHRSSRAKGCVTRQTMLSMIYKMGMCARNPGGDYAASASSGR